MKLRPRFSLRTLLIVVFVTAVACGYGRYWYIRYQIPRQPIPWMAYEAGLVKRLTSEGRPVFLQYTADWDLTSVAPMHMVDTPEVRRSVYESGYVPVLVNVTRFREEDYALLASFGLEAVPATILIHRPPRKPTVLVGMFTKQQLLDAFE